MDPSPSKEYFKAHMDDPELAHMWELSLGKVPGEELYNKTADSEMIHNLADDPANIDLKTSLRQKLDNYLQETEDPRALGLSPWDNYNLDKSPPPK